LQMKDTLFQKISQEKKVLGVVNTRTYTKEKTIHDASASLTILCTLDPTLNPIYFDYRTNSNTQWDFVEFIRCCCSEGYLKKEDVLVVDNASVHSGLESFPLLELLMEVYGFKIIKLPCNSPELNPAEFVFGKLKQHLRKYRGNQDLRSEVIIALAEVTHDNLCNWYKHCTMPKEILPEMSK